MIYFLFVMFVLIIILMIRHDIANAKEKRIFNRRFCDLERAMQAKPEFVEEYGTGYFIPKYSAFEIPVLRNGYPASSLFFRRGYAPKADYAEKDAKGKISFFKNKKEVVKR